VSSAGSVDGGQLGRQRMASGELVTELGLDAGADRGIAVYEASSSRRSRVAIVASSAAMAVLRVPATDARRKTQGGPQRHG
jgi:hypothetical protein